MKFVYNSLQFCTGESHWICVYCDHGEICVLDSLAYVSSLPESAIIQVAKLYPSNSKLIVKRLAVQQQNGYHDCGLFSIAFAVEVCSGRNPERISFVQEAMRSHLLECLSTGIMKAFPKMPTSQESIPRPKSGILQVELFCSCNMPAQYDTEMIQCDRCGQWFHFSCVKLDSAPEQWLCFQCNY